MNQPGAPGGGVEIIEAPRRNEMAALQLDQVIASIRDHYPLLRSAGIERQIADGKQVSALGAFDLKAKAFSVNAPLGFYKNYRHGASLNQPLNNGGYLYGGYKMGRDDIQPWFKERQTNEAGELSAGYGMPLFKDRTIDKRRAELARAGLTRRAVEAQIRIEYLDYVRAGSQVYWEWVASGQSVAAYKNLLALAKKRVEQIQERVKAGDLAEIARINNSQLIAKRETKVIEAERKLQKSAIKLSLFLRDPQGAPQLAGDDQLPAQFPDAFRPELDFLTDDIQNAIASRPEIIDLDLQAQKSRVDLAEAENLTLPQLNAEILASQDMGKRATSTGDKTPFELEVGLYGEMPFQRRKGYGKITSVRGKLVQIAVKRRFVVDKISAMVRDAASAIEAAFARIERAGQNLRLAKETLKLGKDQFEAGDVELIVLNIYEQSVTDAELLLISAKADYFAALADYNAATAQQATAVVRQNPQADATVLP